MESRMLKYLKAQNPDIIYPSNLGKKWTDEEETELLEELSKNVEIKTIAENHNRTIGGIVSRCREIAYKMYVKGIDMNEIINKTKLDTQDILQTITKRENRKIKIKLETELENSKNNNKSSEIAELKNEIANLRQDVKKILNLIHQIYDFETQ